MKYAALRDERGVNVSFSVGEIGNLHVASVKPGAVRGNHSHDLDEVICIMAGQGICEIEVENRTEGVKEKVLVDSEMKTYRIGLG